MLGGSAWPNRRRPATRTPSHDHAKRWAGRPSKDSCVTALATTAGSTTSRNGQSMAVRITPDASVAPAATVAAGRASRRRPARSIDQAPTAPARAMIAGLIAASARTTSRTTVAAASHRSGRPPGIGSVRPSTA